MWVVGVSWKRVIMGKEVFENTIRSRHGRRTPVARMCIFDSRGGERFRTHVAVVDSLKCEVTVDDSWDAYPM
jgi:hypothetical protein